MGDLNVPPAVQEYCEACTSAEPPAAIAARERGSATVNPHWVVGPLVGAVLRILTIIKSPRRALEIGSFTGYATAMILSSLPPDGTLETCESALDSVRSESLDQLKTKSSSLIIQSVDGFSLLKDHPHAKYDLIFIDADKTSIHDFYEVLYSALNLHGVLIVDNALLRGRVIDPKRTFEIQTDAFNRRLARDPRYLAVLLPIRDGLNVAVKLS